MGAPGSRLLLCSLFAGALSFRSAQDLADLSVALAAPWDSPARQRQLGAFDSFGAPEVEEDGSGLIAYLFEELMKKCQAANASKLGEVCAQADAEGLVAKISEKLASADPEVAGWLCKAESTIIDAEKFRQGCSTASQSLMTGIKELLADKMNWKVLGKFAAYTAQAVAAVVPLPPPLAAVLEKCSNWLLSTLSQTAQLSVAQLEDTAGKASEKVVAEEFLRLGAAQVRAAQVQVQDMSMMDDLWLEEMKDTDSQTASLVIQATSFNRWAVIEQDLATSAEILRPPSSLVDMEERAKFAEVLRAQFQLHLLVLSKMFRSLHGGRNAVRLQQVLASKARRLARLLLPDLILLSARDLNRERLGSAPKTSSLSMRVLSSPLLAEPRMRRAMERCRALEDLELSYGSSLAEFEFLVICLWLPLYDEEKIALPLPVKEVYAVDLQGEFGTAWTFFGSFPRGSSGWSEGSDHGLWCDEASGVQAIVRACSATLGCRLEGLCAPLRGHGIRRAGATFTTSGLCTDYVSGGVLAAVMTAVEFRPNIGPHTPVETGVKNSTCALAYRYAEDDSDRGRAV